MDSRRSIRVFGQRSIRSSFCFAPLNRSEGTGIDSLQVKDSKKYQCTSLSDLLDRMAQKPHTFSREVKRKQRPFLSPANSPGNCASGEGKDTAIHRCKEGENGTFSNMVFEQFKCSKNIKENSATKCSPCKDAVHNNIDVGQESKKRKSPCKEQMHASKHFVVLGDDPKPGRNLWVQMLGSCKKPKPLYNHYANGGGWWDCDMEGVDTDEVGCNEAWEGVGSTTLGGLEWH